MLFQFTSRIANLVCLEVQTIGKPYVGELQLRFDEGGWTAVYEQL
jgi:hypothetical protein